MKSTTPNIKDRTALILDLPVTGYEEAQELQSSFVDARKKNIIDTDIFILIEHPPVFTLGRRGGLENLLTTEEFLEKSSIPVVHVERGGNITFHGPGQLLVYPIIDLQSTGLTVPDYVSGLEEIMIRTAADWGINAGRNPINRGVWKKNNKLGSVGIAVRRGISFHGFALNVNLSIEPFTWINPCGLQNIGITSMERELSRKVSMDRVRKAVKGHIEAVFGINLITTRLSELKGRLSSPVWLQ
jgi:lipoate-protein ligase B